MKKHLVFVYGSLKQGFSRHNSLRGQRYIGPAQTEPHYSIYQMGGYPALVDEKHPEGPPRNSGRKIWGELYEVDDACLIELDKIEGVDHGLYERREITLEQINPVCLPTCQDVYSRFHKRAAECYFYCKKVGGARDCNTFWPSN